ncbi:MAG: glycyl-radical enzyme activating protein [Ruminococcaceae bacterium]|nr:glycyl-radical enzyme activating protein [Oscillospiraceae bacterium]
MGKVFDIQRMSVHDGPGIRTTVFLKGCPLRCLWCHNPESQSFDISIGYNPEKCQGCGECVRFCEAHSIADGIHTFDRTKCRHDGKCTDLCLNKAIIVSGHETTADEVLREVMKDKTFYKTTCGGVTFSGGEPLSQPKFLLELLVASKKAGLHTVVDTSGFGKSETVSDIAPYTDLFLWDYKESDESKHIEFTGVSNVPIKENLRLVNELGVPVILRCPIIPGLNDREDHFDGIASIAAELSCVKEVNVMAFHKLGDGKYEFFDMENPTLDVPAMENERKAEIIDSLRKKIAEKTDRNIHVE